MTLREITDTTSPDLDLDLGFAGIRVRHIRSLSADEAEGYGFDSTLRSGPGEPAVEFTLDTGERIVGYLLGKYQAKDPFVVVDLDIFDEPLPLVCSQCGDEDCEHGEDFRLPARFGIVDTRYNNERHGAFITKTQAEEQAAKYNQHAVSS